MIAKGFQPVAWVAAVGAAALSCYMLSLQVAAERAELATLEHRILAARQDIRALQTELGTRGRLQQLEQWNAEVLALAAPVANQFVDSNVSLARFDVRQPALGVEAPVRMASAPTPASPAPQASAPAPRVRLASAPTPTASTVTARTAAAPASDAPLVRRASLTIESPAADPAPARSTKAEPARAARSSRPTRTSGGLLDEKTLRDIGTAARDEQGGSRD